MKLNVVRTAKATAIMAVVFLLAACTGLTENDGKPVVISTPETEQAALEEFLGIVTSPTVFAKCRVLIAIIGSTGNYQWQVAPQVCAACRTPLGDCSNDVEWRWVGQDIDGATIRVERKNGQADCFDVVELQDPQDSQTESLKTSCPGPSDWHYTVSCEGSEECLPPLDPMVRILN